MGFYWLIDSAISVVIVLKTLQPSTTFYNVTPSRTASRQGNERGFLQKQTENYGRTGLIGKRIEAQAGLDALDGGGHVDAVERRGIRAVLVHLTFIDVTLADDADSQTAPALFSVGYAVAA